MNYIPVLDGGTPPLNLMLEQTMPVYTPFAHLWPDERRLVLSDISLDRSLQQDRIFAGHTLRVAVIDPGNAVTPLGDDLYTDPNVPFGVLHQKLIPEGWRSARRDISDGSRHLRGLLRRLAPHRCGACDDTGFAHLRRRLKAVDKWARHHNQVPSILSRPIRNLRTHSSPEVITALEEVARESLMKILNDTAARLNVLCDGVITEADLMLYKRFGGRLQLGSYLPTMNQALLDAYEGGTAPLSQRLQTLLNAKAAGLRLFIVLGPLMPESDLEDFVALLHVVAQLKPETFLVMPRRIENSWERVIREQAQQTGAKVQLELFRPGHRYNRFFEQVRMIRRISTALGLESRLRVWPDSGFLKQIHMKWFSNAEEQRRWIQSHLNQPNI